MPPYRIFLRNDKMRLYRRLAVFIIFINLSIFTYFAIATPDSTTRKMAIAIALPVAICLGIELYLARSNDAKPSYYLIVAEILIITGWVEKENWRATAAVGALWILHLIAGRQLVVTVSKDAITYPSFPSRSWDWKNIEHVILKDGLLTIERRGDRVVQQYTDEKNTTVNEQDFNDFCRLQLEK